MDYTAGFYEKDVGTASDSAKEIVPLVMRLVQPQSVVDVGCGIGIWLEAFAAHGVDDYVGVDGDYVQRSMLRIPEARFTAHDLSLPLRLGRRFDLAVSLEVAEHLPAESAESFVSALTALSDVVLFSAAIPFQGGVHHVNEQWPEYWIDRFQRRGFEAVDCMRGEVWHNRNVAMHYAQNTFLLVERRRLVADPLLRAARRDGPLSIVHPKHYLHVVERMQRVEGLARDLATLAPAGEKLILVDQEEFRSTIAAPYRAIPFLEHNGQYWGSPADDADAIRELRRLIDTGARLLVFAWPAFWWLDHYAGFSAQVRETHRCTMQNERLIAFDLLNS